MTTTELDVFDKTVHKSMNLYGDGTQGWPEHAPYDAAVVAAGNPDIPQPLVDQLVIGASGDSGRVHPAFPGIASGKADRGIRNQRRTLDLGPVCTAGGRSRLERSIIRISS